MKIKRKLTHQDFLETLAELFWKRGMPFHIRSDNGAEFTTRRVRRW